MFKKIVIAVSLVCFGVALGSLASELILRLIIPPLPGTYGHIHQASENKKLAYELVPNSMGVILGANVKINSIGLRDYECLINKPHDVYRIIVLGDSWTFGTGIALEDTYAKQLEQLLNAKPSLMRYEVINAGVGGFNTVREIEFMKEKKLLELNPDLVIVGYNIHNMEIGHQYKDKKQNPAYQGPKTTFLPYNIVSKLKNSSVLMRTITYSNEALMKRLKVRNYRPLYSDSNEGWKAAREALAELADLAQNRGAKVLLAIFPILSNLDDSYPFSEIHQVVKQAVEKQGIMSCDLFLSFKGHNARKLWLHPLDRHPNVTGHRIIAEGIYQYLMEHNLVPVSQVSTHL